MNKSNMQQDQYKLIYYLSISQRVSFVVIQFKRCLIDVKRFIFFFYFLFFMFYSISHVQPPANSFDLKINI